jgi:hypothetical protein
VPIPVPVPATPLTINDDVTARAEALLTAFVQVVKNGTAGASLNTPAWTVDNKNSGGSTPVTLDTPEKQIFTRAQFIALASVLGGSVNGQVAGSTSGPTTASAAYVVIPEMTLPLNTNGKTVLIQFSSSFNLQAADAFDFAIHVDGSIHAPSTRHMESATAVASLVGSTQALITGLAAGAHTFDVRWKQTAGSARAVGVLRSLIVTELG